MERPHYENARILHRYKLICKARNVTCLLAESACIKVTRGNKGAHAVISSNAVHCRQLHSIHKSIDEVRPWPLRRVLKSLLTLGYKAEAWSKRKMYAEIIF